MSIASSIPVAQFRKLERFREHTIDVVVGAIDAKRILKARNLVQRALEIGRGTAHLLDAKNRLTVMSTEMSCPGCGRAFEELDPRLFSFNSPHGWCEACHGFGEIWNEKVQTREEETGDSMLENELSAERQFESLEEGEAVPCPDCHGARLNPVARHVRLQGKTIDEFTARSAGRSARARRRSCVSAARKKRSPPTSCRRSSSGSASWKTSGSVISRSAAPRRR